MFAGGEPPPAAAVSALVAQEAPTVIAADSGLDHALALGLVVDLVVGDMDSVSPGARAAAASEGVVFEVHPVDKDATDLELALCAARDRGASRVTVVGGGGGRHDHLLANALLLASDVFAALEVDALVGTARITVVRSATTLHGRPGALCSLVAVGGPASRVHTRGLRFPLDGEDLHPGSTRGVSNEFASETAVVSVGGGVLLAIQPHALLGRG